MGTSLSSTRILALAVSKKSEVKEDMGRVETCPAFRNIRDGADGADDADMLRSGLLTFPVASSTDSSDHELSSIPRGESRREEIRLI